MGFLGRMSKECQEYIPKICNPSRIIMQGMKVVPAQLKQSNAAYIGQQQYKMLEVDHHFSDKSKIINSEDDKSKLLPLFNQEKTHG